MYVCVIIHIIITNANYWEQQYKYTQSVENSTDEELLSLPGRIWVNSFQVKLH